MDSEALEMSKGKGRDPCRTLPEHLAVLFQKAVRPKQPKLYTKHSVFSLRFNRRTRPKTLKRLVYWNAILLMHGPFFLISLISSKVLEYLDKIDYLDGDNVPN